ncbi:MAG: hypothetical protein H0X24_25195 [Ktedonobacterales bacterium]|nr:hypothetical protein [Ktedonobacterales bacterium]
MHIIKAGRTEVALFAGMFALLWGLALVFHQDATHISYAAHFVAQDRSWLNGQLDVPAWLGHDLVRLGNKEYIVYPPAPALLMLPFVALLGDHFSDIWFGWLAGAANVALLHAVVRQLGARGWSARTPREQVVLVLTFGVGTIALWLALGGTVWFVAQTLAITFTLLMVLGALHGNWWLASAALGALFLTRSPDVLGGIVVLACFAHSSMRPTPATLNQAANEETHDLEQTLPHARRRAPAVAWRTLIGSAVLASLRSLKWRAVTALAVPCGVALVIWAVRNKLYFGSFFESGYGMQIAQDYPQIRFGLVSWHYLWPNFIANFLNLPAFTFRTPYDLLPQIDLLRGGNGTSLFFTTPLFLLFFAPARSRLPGWLRTALWATVGTLVVVTLAWNLTGWYQVGARYLFDAYPYLFVLLAARGGRVSGRWLALAAFGVLVNLVLAQIFWCHSGACFADSPHRLAIFVGLLALVPLVAGGAWWWLKRETTAAMQASATVGQG